MNLFSSVQFCETGGVEACTLLTLSYMYFACSYIYEETSHGPFAHLWVADPSCVRETERKLTGRFIVSHNWSATGPPPCPKECTESRRDRSPWTIQA